MHSGGLDDDDMTILDELVLLISACSVGLSQILCLSMPAMLAARRFGDSGLTRR